MNDDIGNTLAVHERELWAPHPRRKVTQPAPRKTPDCAKTQESIDDEAFFLCAWIPLLRIAIGFRGGWTANPKFMFLSEVEEDIDGGLVRTSVYEWERDLLSHIVTCLFTGKFGERARGAKGKGAVRPMPGQPVEKKTQLTLWPE